MSAGILYKVDKVTNRGRPRIFTDIERLERRRQKDLASKTNTYITFYSITSPHLPDAIYVGKTGLKLECRFRVHKNPSSTTSSKIIVDAGNAEILEIDRCPIDFNIDEILDIEMDWIQIYRNMGYNVVNKNERGNPERIKQKQKQYYQEHKEKYNQYSKQYYLNNKRTQE
jgi:hypothetical protein